MGSYLLENANRPIERETGELCDNQGSAIASDAIARNPNSRPAAMAEA
jgi:hypothetical protein